MNIKMVVRVCARNAMLGIDWGMMGNVCWGIRDAHRGMR